MCIPSALQQHILQLTGGGKTIADFLHATMQGETRNAKIHHQLEAAKHLAKIALGHTVADTSIRHSRENGNPEGRGEEPVSPTTVHPEPVEGHDRDAAHENAPTPSTEEDRIATPTPSSFPHPTPSSFLRKQESTLDDSAPQEAAENPNHPIHPVSSTPVTDIDIINYEIARLIREETNDGYAIAEFLARIMHGSSPGELEYSHRDRIISPADRMAAAKELLSRGFGRLGSPRGNARQDDSDLIQSGLARYIRERTNHGLEAVRLLLDVASGHDEAFSMHQRVVATRELIRRGWDTNYDAITSADIVAYYERQDAAEPTKYDIALEEWLEQERAAHRARVESHEEEAQPEPGLFAHLANAEITRYDSMTTQEQADFVEQQRQRHTQAQPEAHAAQPTNQPETAAAAVQPAATQPTNQPETAAAVQPAATQPTAQPETAAAQPTSQPETAAAQPDSAPVIPASPPVIPAPSPVIPAEAGIHTPDTHDDFIPTESDETSDDPDENSENTDLNTLVQQVTTPSPTPNPTHPVPSRARSP